MFKFRLKNILTGEINPPNASIEVKFDENSNFYFNCLVDNKYSVEVCTNFIDTNGNEIFEGDTVILNLTTAKVKLKVVFENGAFYMKGANPIVENNIYFNKFFVIQLNQKKISELGLEILGNSLLTNS